MRGQQVDAATEELFERLGEGQGAVGVAVTGGGVGEGGDHVEIAAGGVEGAGGGRAEELQTTDAELPAERDQFRPCDR